MTLPSGSEAKEAVSDIASTGAMAATAKFSDNDSVRTEDFNSRFAQIMMGDGASRNGLADADSVRTEDFAREFSKTMSAGQRDPLHHHHQQQQQQQLLHRQYRPLTTAGGYRPQTSAAAAQPLLLRDPDLESVKTEDFENKFRSMLVRGPAPPVAAFDDSYISSSDSAARAQLLRERVGKLFRVPPGGIRLAAGAGAAAAVEPLHDSGFDRRRIEPQLPRRRGSPLRSQPTKVQSLSAPRLTGSPTRQRGRQLGRISPIREVPGASSFDIDDDLLAADDEEFANEVRYQSQLIQRELEMERRKRAAGRDSGQMSPIRIGNTPRESLDKKVLELDELNYQVRKTLQEKEKILAELHFVQDCLRKHQAEVRLSEKLCKDNKSKAEDTKTELMLAEMKRDSTAKELDYLNHELGSKKDQLKRMEETCKARTRELQDLENIGIAKEEIENILTERDELYQLIRQNEDAEFQRYELEKKLTQTREEMQAQANIAQQKVIALEEELEASLTKIAETSEERNSLKMRLGEMDDKLRMLSSSLDDLAETNHRLLRSKEVVDKEHADEMEKLKLRMQGDLSHIQRRTEDEELSFKRQIQQLKDNLDTVQMELDRKEEANCSLREQLLRLESQLGHEAETKTHLLTETERHLQQTEAEADKKLDAAKEQLRRDMEERISRQRAAWQAESEKEIQKIKDKHQRSVSHLEYELSCKEEEMQAIRDALRGKESELHLLEEEHKTELRERVRAAVRTEREKLEKDSSERWRKELTTLKEETARTIDSLQAENRKKAEAIKSLEQQRSQLSSEAEREREKAKIAQREKLAAISRIKEIAKEETAKELHHVRSRVESAAYEEVDRLRSELQSAKESLSLAKADLDVAARREAEASGNLDRMERAVISQVNAQCARTAQVLGVAPRLAPTSGGSISGRQDQQQQQQQDAQSQRSQGGTHHGIAAALANMEACSEELRSFAAELQDELHKQKDQLQQQLAVKDAQVTKLRSQLTEEKEQEVQVMRERLIKEHMDELAKLAKSHNEAMEGSLKAKEEEVRELRENMKKWKNETAERLAVRLQDEFRREFDRKIRDLRNTVRSKDQELLSFRKEMEGLEQEITKSQSQRSTTTQAAAAAADPNSSRSVSQLQEQVRHLREANASLRKSAYSAKPPTVSLAATAVAAAASAGTPPPLQQASLAQQYAASRGFSGSLSSLQQQQQQNHNSADGYVNQLEGKLRALEERVRRAERQSEQLDKDRLNSLTKKELQLQLGDGINSGRGSRGSLRHSSGGR